MLSHLESFQLQNYATNSTWSLHAHSAQVSTVQVWLRDCREKYVVQTPTVYVLQGASRVWHKGLVIQQFPVGILVTWPGNYNTHTSSLHIGGSFFYQHDQARLSAGEN